MGRGSPTTPETEVWQAAQALGLVLAVVGVVMIFGGGSAAVMLVGMAIFFSARIGAWWMHG